MIGVFHVTLTFLVTTLGRLLYVVDFQKFFQISNPKVFFLMINPLQIDALG